MFLTPRTGWRALLEDAFTLLAYDGSSWREIVASRAPVDQFTRLGIGTPSDAGNPLSARLNNALFAALPVAAGGSGDFRFKLNKESGVNTVSQLYQSNWSGRAETGLMGDDVFRIKVSSDGSSWLTALNVDPSTGYVGIGASTPQARLDVAGGIAVNGKIAVNGPAFSATTVVGTSQPLVAGSYTKIQFRNEEFDTADAFDNVNSFAFKPMVAGYYQVTANVRTGSPNIGDWQVMIYRNGVAYKSGSEIFLASGANYQSHVSVLVYLNGSTDYVEAFVYVDVPSAVRGSVTGSYFQAVMVRGA